ncbi:hypothetical protein FB566_3928 [Stackebrandtia endophytica]|uniref:Uncharacterized protein n=1 Tax=Stackebrandtia endophytica TaxID=1496996 RepID=A0A543B0I5_9ACTN|nr:hypothetical protein [Stackebrandtia endophytica]TQL78345.1 hypothetical protein FB566_3928 [Stackebrandtia endophytica]
MKRMIPAALVALGLFVLNVAARVIVELTGQADDADAQFTIGLYATIGMALVALVVTAIWGTRKPVDRLFAELGPAIGVAVLLSVLVAPLLVGGNPFVGGPGWIFIQLLFFAGVTGLGALLGYLIITIVALDYRSQNLRRVERHYGARAAARAEKAAAKASETGKKAKSNQQTGKKQGGKKKSKSGKPATKPTEKASSADKTEKVESEEKAEKVEPEDNATDSPEDTDTENVDGDKVDAERPVSS